MIVKYDGSIKSSILFRQKIRIKWFKKVSNAHLSLIPVLNNRWIKKTRKSIQKVLSVLNLLRNQIKETSVIAKYIYLKRQAWDENFIIIIFINYGQTFIILQKNEDVIFYTILFCNKIELHKHNYKSFIISFHIRYVKWSIYLS